LDFGGEYIAAALLNELSINRTAEKLKTNNPLLRPAVGERERAKAPGMEYGWTKLIA
jgi:hypothetical protein